MAAIDHLILHVNEVAPSVRFLCSTFWASNWRVRTDHSPLIRVSEHFTLLLAPGGTGGTNILRFALSRAAFDKAFALLKEKGESPTATRFIQW